MPSLATFNANNFFLRYKFTQGYPGASPKAVQEELAKVASQGFLPAPVFGKFSLNHFIVWDSSRRELAAEALRRPDNRLPDILCLQEVENVQAMRTFNQNYLGGHYRYSLLIDGYDPRNIDVGLLSVFPIREIRSHIEDVEDDGRRLFECRDCLEANIQLPQGEVLSLLVNHLKSKFVEKEKNDTEETYRKKVRESHEKRRAQAKKVLEFVRKRFAGRQDEALYAVVGDFNDTPESPYLHDLMASRLLTNVIRKCRPAHDYWTYYWRSKNRVSQIDYVMVSKALLKRIEAVVTADPAKKPHIERAGLAFSKLNAKKEILPKQVTLVHFEEDEATPPSSSATPPAKLDFQFARFEKVLENWKNNVSDHCPVKVWF
jgi:endonuclease/exonuclease/phosphatase family metal-dependent hydrolase